MDAARTVLEGDLLVHDGAIAALGPQVAQALAALPGGRPDDTVDAAGALVLPGFVHGHLHLCQTLFRGLAEQADLLRWLRERIWPLEAAHTEASIAASARLGVLELLAGGVTCINDMGTVRHTDAIGQTLTDAGIRAVFGKALMDQGAGVPKGLLESSADAMAGALALADRFDGSAGGRLRVSLAPRFILSCSDALWRDVASASAERGLVVHTHIAESPAEGEEIRAAVATTAARYFSTRGVLSERFVGAHGVWLDDEELSQLRRADAALVHCPGSNLKLGSGLASVRAWKRAEVRCGLGSDGAACNNRLDTFHEMSLAAGVSRVRGAAASARDTMARATTSASLGAPVGAPIIAPDSPLTAQEIVALATCDGAAALGLGRVVGSLEAGKRADLAIVDISGAHHGPDPLRDPYVTLVHATRASDVKLTMVEGRVLYRAGQWTTLDPGAVLAAARAEARGVVRRAEAGEAA